MKTKDTIRITIRKTDYLYHLAAEYCKLVQESNPELRPWTVKDVIETMAVIRLESRIKDMKEEVSAE